MHYLVWFVFSDRIIGEKTLTSGLAIALLVCSEERVNKKIRSPGEHPLNVILPKIIAQGPACCERHAQKRCSMFNTL